MLTLQSSKSQILYLLIFLFKWARLVLDRFSNGRDYSYIYCSSPDHSKTEPFENRPLKCPVFECFRFSKGRISDPYCIILRMW